MKKVNEEIISYAENELMGKDAMRRMILVEGSMERTPKRRLWKTLVPVAACLLAVCFITVFAIPSARAEVLSWFGIAKTPVEYLNQEPGERVPVPALDEVIVQPVDSSNEGEVGSTTDNRIITVADEPIWQRIADDFAIELGETLVDGEKMYLTIKMHGLTALPAADAVIGGNATRYIVPADYLPNIFPDGVPAEYADGTANFWEPAEADIYLILEDGTSIRCLDVNTANAFSELFALRNEYGSPETLVGNDEAMEQLSRMCMEWLDGRTVSQTVACELRAIEYQNRLVDDPVAFLADRADEDGMLRAKVVYRARHYCPQPVVMLEAELGEACFDVRSCLGFDSTPLMAEVPEITLGSREVILTCRDWDDSNTVWSVTNVAADLAGIKLTPETAYVNAFGLNGAAFTITFPEDWTEDMCHAFAFGLSFKAQVDGSEYTITGFSREKLGEREYRIAFYTMHLPYDNIENTQELKIIPELSYYTAMWKNETTRVELQVGETVVKPIRFSHFDVSRPIELTDAIMVFTAGD